MRYALFHVGFARLLSRHLPPERWLFRPFEAGASESKAVRTCACALARRMEVFLQSSEAAAAAAGDNEFALLRHHGVWLAAVAHRDVLFRSIGWLPRADSVAVVRFLLEVGSVGCCGSGRDVCVCVWL
jgi:trimethylamine:corrinoid methyltransferase-like protein